MVSKHKRNQSKLVNSASAPAIFPQKLPVINPASLSESQRTKQFQNSLNGLLTGLGFNQQFGEQLSQTTTLLLNNRTYFLSNDWVTLSYMYSTHGIVQTLIDQPVEDAFRGGIDIKSSQLDTNEIQELQNWIKECGDIEEIKDCIKWTRLYGGGGLIINVALGEPQGKFNPENIKRNTKLSFYAADLWELNNAQVNTYGNEKPYLPMVNLEAPYNFYGQVLNKQRVLRMNGKRAPSYLRAQLRYWGMSECERLVRSLNQYLKNQDVVFELLDEAKVDVYKITDFNTSLYSQGGTEQITQRIQLSNQLKNFQNAIVMDKEDEYEQKIMQFTGLNDMLDQIRKGIACDTKIPIEKLFGQSAGGMNSGEDSLENYNSLIESEIRGKFDSQIIQVLKLRCQQLFGIIPEDLQIGYKPLRILSAEQEENVKDKQFRRLLELHDKALISPKATIETINVNDLCGSEFDEGDLEDQPIQLEVESDESLKQPSAKKENVLR